MLVRPILETEKELYNKVVTHPLQSWEWGEFKHLEGVAVERVGFFENGKLLNAFQVFFHKLPHTGYTMGYCPKASIPEENQISAIRQLGEKYSAVAVKLEPNLSQEVDGTDVFMDVKKFLMDSGCVEGKPLFTRYTFILSLEKSEEELFAQLKSKTRYNVNLASKKGVQIVENSTDEGLEAHLVILDETTKRQKFYAHTPDYFKQMWNLLKSTGMMRIFEARYEGKVLTSWIIFIFGDTMYYPYGASTIEHREVMASNLMMWEMIRFGRAMGLKKFDMWGALGPNPDEKDPWFGFHKFKEGYAAELYEFLGTYDLVIQPIPYKIYRLAEILRWKYLRLRATVGM